MTIMAKIAIASIVGVGSIFTGIAAKAGWKFWQRNRQTIPISGRRHTIWLSIQDERDYGTHHFDKIKQDALKAGTLEQQDKTTRRLRKIFKMISDAACHPTGGGYTDHMEGLEWEIILVNDPRFNAYVLPGGKVVVYTGLERNVTDDDELAFILAHECGHLLGRHGAERLAHDGLCDFLEAVFQNKAESSDAHQAANEEMSIATAFDLAWIKPYSRMMEREADHIGLMLAAQAGFNPRGAYTFFQKLEGLEAGSSDKHVPGLFDTHPPTLERKEWVKEALPSAIMLYENKPMFLRMQQRFSRSPVSMLVTRGV